jgi:hypothetical protein
MRGAHPATRRHAHPSLYRPVEIRSHHLLGGLSGRRHSVFERRILPDPHRHPAERVLRLRRFRPVHDGRGRNFDIAAQIRTEIEPLVTLLGRCARIAVEQHDVGNVFRICDNVMHKIVTVRCCAWLLSHGGSLPGNIRLNEGLAPRTKKAGAPLKVPVRGLSAVNSTFIGGRRSG